MAEESDFDIIVSAAGLTLSASEKERMKEGYANLQTLMARIPDMALAPDEPAVAYVMPSTCVRR